MIFRRVLDFLAKMGLTMRDDPPKVVDLSIREFGEVQQGLVLSIRQIPRDDPDALASLSVVIRNVGEEPWNFVVPGWLAFYQLDVRTHDGSPAPLTPFGKALLKPEHSRERVGASLPAGALNETEIPLGSMFSLKRREPYLVRVSCDPAADVTLKSNELVLS